MIRLLLLPLTGVGAPFVLFFAAVLVSSFLWGAGPGIVASFLSAPISAYLFVIQAHYSRSQALAQGIVFLLEILTVCFLADRFSKAKKCVESNERALKNALNDRQRDISEIRRVSEALRKSDVELREAQRIAKVGSWSWDAKHDVAVWSDELFRIFGRDPKLGVPKIKEVLSFYTPASRSRLEQAIQQAARDGTSYSLELEFTLPDGTKRCMSSHGEAVRSATGSITGVRGTAQDITEIKELQQMREEWTSVIAHDLRQPIGVIKMSSELLPLLHHGSMSENEKATKERIRTSATQLARMVDDLLDISRMEASRLILSRNWQDPRTIVRESLERLMPLIHDHKVTFDEDGDLSPVYVDRMRIEQVLGNVLTNAAKYGRKGSDIRIRLRPLVDSVEVSVANEGQGISSDEIPVIFSRFWRSQSTRGSGVPGLGLGLYISKGLIEAHGGRIWAKSIPNETTTFFFTLPTRVVSEKRAA